MISPVTMMKPLNSNCVKVFISHDYWTLITTMALNDMRPHQLCARWVMNGDLDLQWQMMLIYMIVPLMKHNV